MYRIPVRAAAGAVALTASIAFQPALAQAPDPAPVAEPKSEHQTEPVTVTGTAPLEYRANNANVGVLGNTPLIRTPFSVNVITQDLLVNQQASFLGDFLKDDPSANVGNVVISFATLRGFLLGSDGYLLDGLTVGSLLLDGRVALPAFERIDVLKGANVFLTGLGGTASLGGALNYIPKTPPTAPIRNVALTYASQSQFGVEADLGDRFGGDGQFGYRINLGYRDGNTAVDEQTWEQGNASIVLDWRVNSALTLQGGLYYVNNDYENIQPFFVGATGPIPDAPDTRKNLGPDWSTFNQNATIGWVKADWAFAPNWTATLQFGGGQNNRPHEQGEMDTRFGVITSATGDIGLFASEESARVNVQTGQLLVRGKVVSGPVQHALTLGGSGFEEKNYGSFLVAGVLPGNLSTGTGNQPQPAPVPLDNLPYTGKTTSYGLLVSDIMSFGEHWSVLLGGRQAEVTNYDADDEEIPGGSISRFSPAVALMYKPAASSLIYANYAQGLEPGGEAPTFATNSGQAMPPMVTSQYEIGAKLQTSGLTLTAAVFDMQKPLQFLNGSGVWVEEGNQVHRGVEVLATGLLTRDLRIVAGAMFLDAEQEGDPATEGNQVPGVPRWTANAFFDYAIRAVPGLFVNAGVYYTDKQYFDVQNLQSIPSWVRFDIGGRYETVIGGKNTSFFLTVENVANKSYWQSAIGSALTLGDPLTVKATARVAF
jgi:iron complex outermembrane receptor protein